MLPPATTLPQVLARSLRLPAAFAVGASTVLWVGTSVLSGQSEKVPLESKAVAEQGAAPPSLATVLVQRHDCWTGAAPTARQGTVPGHVVLSYREGAEVVTTYGGEVWVGRALEELFGDGDPRVVAVHGFCR